MRIKQFINSEVRVTKMKGLTILTVTALAGMLFSLQAYAVYTGTVDLELNGYGAGGRVAFWASNDDNYDPTQYWTYEARFSSAQAGIYNQVKLSSTGEGDLLPDRFGGFCVEIGQQRMDGKYNVAFPKDAPDPGEYSGGAMGQEKATLLRKMWSMAFDDAWYERDYLQTAANNQAAEAFGVAVWEIVHERSDIYDVTDGSFLVSPWLWEDQVDLGNDYVNNLIADAMNYDGPLANLRVLTSPEGQDILVEVPEPSTTVLMGSGLLMALGLFRRRKR